MKSAGRRGYSPLARVMTLAVMLLTMAAGGAWAQEPTKYTVTMAEGTVDKDNWTISPTEATENTTVTATYKGTKHVKSVTAVTKAAAAKALSEATAADVGKVIGTDGKLYDKVSDVPTGVTASAIIAYVGAAGSVDASSTTYKGLAISLTDANSGNTCAWYTSANGPCVSESNEIATAITYKNGIACTETLINSNGSGVTTNCSGHTHAAATAASSYATARPSGVSAWFLPSIGQWNLIAQGLASKKAGSTISTDLEPGSDNYKADYLNSVITDAGGTGFVSGNDYPYNYWSSTECGSWLGWCTDFDRGRASNLSIEMSCHVRAVLAF